MLFGPNRTTTHRSWRFCSLPLLILILLQGAALPCRSGDTASEEKEECIRNLKQIYTAIQAYQKDHKDLPNWLSDLVPGYLNDANVLVCPVGRRTGRIENPPLADPKISSSYLFEFCPVPLGGEAPNAPNRTRREWKRRQMGLVGSVVPIVRCRFHDPILNLAFDGTVYESTPAWESMLTNRINPEELIPQRLFAQEAPPETHAATAPRQYPARDPKAGPQLLDLTSFYNALLTDSWHGNTGNDLGALPAGVQTLGGVAFDVRGIVQLGGKSPGAARFPPELKAIPVHQKCQYIHFLHAAAFGKVSDEGQQIGSYILHFAANSMRLEIPIIYGQHVRDWHALADEPKGGKELRIVWQGQNAISKAQNHSLRLFLTTWQNPAPSSEIDSIDYVSSMSDPAPFLIAISTD